MTDEQVIEITKHIDRSKVTGNTYTIEDLEAISELLNMYENEKFKRIQAENDREYLIQELRKLLSKF